LHYNFSKGKAELQAEPEAEALPKVLTFCWKRMRQKALVEALRVEVEAEVPKILVLPHHSLK
jgi:hypothetical protein